MTVRQKLGLDKEPVFLMDGTAYIYRGFYASRQMRRSDGFPTNALVIVTRILLKILRRESPTHFLFVMDGQGPTFRKDIYADYKANREAMPEDLVSQMEPLRRMVDALGIPRHVTHGYEADDCMASLAARFSADNPVLIVSGDKDLKQCLGPSVYMWDPGAKEEKLIGEAEFEAETGISPGRWPDFQALVGDAADNIPGVPGIGPKTARQIFEICPSLEDIRDHFALLPPKIQKKLEPHLREMFTWRRLTSLRRDFCQELSLADLTLLPPDAAACGRLADEFELFAVRREIAAVCQNWLKIHPAGADVGSGSAARNKEQATGAPAPRAARISEAGALPACAGQTVAVIWPEGQGKPPAVSVANDSLEFVWTGSTAQLCAWLGDAGKIIVPDLKGLLVAMPSWSLLANEKASAFMDTGLAAYLLDPEDGDYSFSRLASRWAGDSRDAGPASRLIAICHALEKNLAASGLSELYERMELPLVFVLAAMEKRGVAIDPAAFQFFLRDVRAELDSLTERVYAQAGFVFNIRSPQQLGDALFNRLKLCASGKTRGGQPSTSQMTLEKLAPENPVVESILQFRKLDKMRSTYLDPLPRLMDANSRIHTTFNQEATATGRLSSSNPNLQNIPVRGSLGKRMRACFVPGPGLALLAADYSQIELRILAHLSRDAHLLQAFRNGEDIHARTAALIFDMPRDKVLPDQRRMAKTINFGLLYGMGARKLALELKIGATQAREFIDRYFERFSTLKNFYEKIIDGARAQGYVTTMAGRKRWLPGINSANGQTSAQAERQAVNTVIQGSAADIIKLAMLAVDNDAMLSSLNVRLVLQVHDELLLEAPENVAEEACARVASLMEAVRPGGQALSIPLAVDWGVGNNWGMAH